MTYIPDVVKICSDLIKINSENPPGDTSEVIDYIQDIFEKSGIPYERIDLEGGKSNIHTGFGNKPLLLLGHVDVVPAMPDGWYYDPNSGKIVDGHIYGRGSTDMKGGCAAILTAFINEFMESGSTPANLCFVCDEENGGPSGIRYLLDREFMEPCDCLIAECTPKDHPSIGQKGILRLKIFFRGHPGHGSLYPEMGVSSIEKALDFVGRVREISRRSFTISPEMEEIIGDSERVIRKVLESVPAENILKKITYNPGVIRGGEKINIVAQRCCLELEMRIPWGCNPYDLLEELNPGGDEDLFEVEEIFEPTYTDRNSDIVRIAVENIGKVYENESFPFVQWAATDARFMRKKGFRVIEYGPGEVDKLHAVNETISIENLKKSVEVYRGIIRSYM